MSDSATETIVVPDDRPPGWANSFVKWALTTPVIEKWLGQTLALLTFRGRRTQKEYVIPVSYWREDDVVTIVTKRSRKWWHNFEDPAMVQLRLAGVVHEGKAGIVIDEEEILVFMLEYLAKRPVDAKAYGLGKEDIVAEKVSALIPQIVMIRIELEPA